MNILLFFTAAPALFILAWAIVRSTVPPSPTDESMSLIIGVSYLFFIIFNKIVHFFYKNFHKINHTSVKFKQKSGTFSGCGFKQNGDCSDNSATCNAFMFYQTGTREKMLFLIFSLLFL